jgi:peptide/nickel transport system substrate-binding protein
MVVDDRAKKFLSAKLKTSKTDAVGFSQQADDKLERLFIKRFSRLVPVRRFIILWTCLFVLLFIATFFQLRSLGKYYQTLQPVAGGFYNEGIIGKFTTANPLYATGSADTAVSRLVFSGLFKYDDKNQLVGDLAQDWQQGTSPSEYIIHLRHGVKWQDGKPFTADDVVYTYHTIQDIEAQSSLYSSWQGITVTKIDKYDVKFDLPNPLTSFPYSLTNGIVPAHLLKPIAPQELRSAAFNNHPVGTGPFAWKFVDVSGLSTDNQQQRITLTASKNYWLGKPKLNGFNINTFTDDIHMVDAFKKKQLNAMSGLDTLPAGLDKDFNVQTHVTPLNSEVMAFFNNSHPGLSDAKVRQALVSAVPRDSISSLSSFPVKVADSPLLRGQLAYDPTVTQLPFDINYANQQLDAAGWLKNDKGIRVKDNKPLTLLMLTRDTADYTKTAIFLQQQWAKLGVKVIPSYASNEDLQLAIANHGYDILLYGITIGVDPDVYAYWDSSQAPITSQGHLNLSEYKSTAADQALEFGRTRSDPSLRVVKYKSFLSAWRNDAPALALYQPNYLYITRGPVFNYERRANNSSADRFYNVDQWMIRQKRQDNS